MLGDSVMSGPVLLPQYGEWLIELLKM